MKSIKITEETKKQLEQFEANGTRIVCCNFCECGACDYDTIVSKDDGYVKCNKCGHVWQRFFNYTLNMVPYL